ncbi:MAG TPA: DHH family phosphoesterase [Alphaproteobacteria bacterium]|nr:DHH family phosphoesterase [Alphaproteobacteria bacterium]
MKNNFNSNRNHTHSESNVMYEDREKSASRLMDAHDGSFFDGIVKINRKAKPGPVVFLVSDGESSIDAVTKDSPFEVNDVVHIMGPVSERAGRRQIEISRMEKSDANFDKIIEKISIPKRTEFSIKSKRYDIMKPRFIEIAKRIRKAILDNEPIIIRHHNDADGISSGICLELACANVMKGIGVNPEHNLYRSPSRAPFYEVSDVFRDISLSKRITDTHGQKKPLVIVADNGSTPEDAFAFKTLKMLGYDAIVIDHHNPVDFVLPDKSRSSVCDYLELHLNPYLFGLDSQTSAGMLCYEMARLIDETFGNFENGSDNIVNIIPAMAAVADRCDIEETHAYIKNSKLTKEELSRIGTAIDFMAYHMKFDISTPVIKELLSRKEFVDMINQEVHEGIETQLQSTMPYLRTLDINGIILNHIDLEKYTLRFTYPSAGKVIGLIHDKVAEGKTHTPVISLGCVSDMIIVRATKPVLPVQKIIESIQKHIPEANADGGGHECAGSIKFVPAHMDRVLQLVKDELHKIDPAKLE